MRIRISYDGATTEAVRAMAAELSRIGLRSTMTVGLDGPELWNGETPHLTPGQFAQVAARLVKYDGRSLADTIDEMRKAS